jgi:hypothetical protein
MPRLAFLAVLTLLFVVTSIPMSAQAVLLKTHSSLGLTDGLIAYYSFDDGAGTDTSGNSHNGVIHGTPETVDGVIGKALKFDGVEDYIEVANSPALNPSQMTLSAWINPLDISQPVFGHKHYIVVSKEIQYEIAVLGQPQDSAVTSEVAFGLNPRWLWYGSNHLVELGEFIHIAVTFDSSFKAAFYVNGAKTRELQYPGGISPTNNCLRIGARGCDSRYNFQPFAFFNGLIDEVSIYDRALSTDEVQALHQKATPALVDTDGDGIFDNWEEQGGGIDTNHDGKVDLDLYTLGARPKRRDIFVEIDYMQGARPLTESIEDVKAAFAKAPIWDEDIDNDGSQGKVPQGIEPGVNLIYQIDEEVPTTDSVLFNSVGSGNFDDLYDFRYGVNNAVLQPGPNNTYLVKFHDVLDPARVCGTEQNSAKFGTRAERSDPNCVNIISAKALVFRYALFGKKLAEKRETTGSADPDGHELFISQDNVRHVANNKIRASEAGTFMHELGHTLGLLHGGGEQDSPGKQDDAYDCKPNYFSVMNYYYQLPLADPIRPLDYSSWEANTLDENSLDERDGVNAPFSRTVFYGDAINNRFWGDLPKTNESINWNRNLVIDSIRVSADVNEPGNETVDSIVYGIY